MQFNEAFGDINYDIDKKARELNNKKKYLYDNVKKSNKLQENESVRGIEAFNNQPGFHFSPRQNFKGDFSSSLPTPLDEKSDDDNKSLGDSFSLGQNSEHFLSLSKSDSDIMSEYSYLPKKKKKHLRLNTEHLQKYTENEEEHIFEHIKNCYECKKQLIDLLKSENESTQNKIHDNKISDDIIQKNNSLFEKINYKELKEVIILIIIGIIIIFVLDIFLRR